MKGVINYVPLPMLQTQGIETALCGLPGVILSRSHQVSKYPYQMQFDPQVH